MIASVDIWPPPVAFIFLPTPLTQPVERCGTKVQISTYFKNFHFSISTHSGNSKWTRVELINKKKSKKILWLFSWNSELMIHTWEIGAIQLTSNRELIVMTHFPSLVTLMIRSIPLSLRESIAAFFGKSSNWISSSVNRSEARERND